MKHLWNDTLKETLKYLAENQSRCSYIPPQIPHKLAIDRTRSSAVTVRGLTSWTMEVLRFLLMLIQFWVSCAVYQWILLQFSTGLDRTIPFFSSCGLDKIPGNEYILSLFTGIKKMGMAGSSETHSSYRSHKTGSTFAVTQQKTLKSVFNYFLLHKGISH